MTGGETQGTDCLDTGRWAPVSGPLRSNVQGDSRSHSRWRWATRARERKGRAFWALEDGPTWRPLDHEETSENAEGTEGGLVWLGLRRGNSKLWSVVGEVDRDQIVKEFGFYSECVKRSLQKAMTSRFILNNPRTLNKVGGGYMKQTWPFIDHCWSCMPGTWYALFLWIFKFFHN